MSRSSIFSFETWQGRGPWTLALVPVLVLVLVVEFGLARQDWVWTYVEQSASGIVPAIEREVIGKHAPPRVVVVGSSRTRDGIAPNVVEAALGWPKHTVFNLSITGGHPTDVLRFYNGHREWFKETKVLVVGVEDWQFNRNLPPGERDFYHADLDYRISGLHNLEDTLGMLAGFVWRTYEAQLPLRRLAKSILLGKPAPVAFTKDMRPVWRASTPDESGPETLNTDADVARFYKDFDFSDVRLEQLRTIAAMAKEDGVEVVWLQLPLRDSYTAKVAKDEESAQAYGRYEEAVKSIEGTTAIMGWRASDAGLEQTMFYDYGHMTPTGAEIASKALAAQLRTHVEGIDAAP